MISHRIIGTSVQQVQQHLGSCPKELENILPKKKTTEGLDNSYQADVCRRQISSPTVHSGRPCTWFRNGVSGNCGSVGVGSFVWWKLGGRSSSTTASLAWLWAVILILLPSSCSSLYCFFPQIDFHFPFLQDEVKNSMSITWELWKELGRACGGRWTVTCRVVALFLLLLVAVKLCTCFFFGYSYCNWKYW